MNLYALLKNNDINRVQLSDELQNDLNDYFDGTIITFTSKTEIQFNGEYKPEDNQILTITDYDLPFSIDFNNPLKIERLTNDKIESIKGLIVNNNDFVLFQTFDNRKIIKPEKWHLIYSSNTFSKIENKGITIEQKIDVLYKIHEKKLLFFSYHNASKIFDLSDYYRGATNNEINNFLNNDLFSTSEININLFNSRLRKKVFQIEKNKVLEKVANKIEEIKNYANSIGIQLNLDSSNKIVFPSDKKEIEQFIYFLNDDLYKSPITEFCYETNSKRKINME